MALQEIDILNPDSYLLDVPHDRFERLRREAPVFWHKEPNGPGFWAITKHADVLTVLKDAETFSSQVGGTQIADLPSTDIRRSPAVLAVMDPPRHTQHRALIAQSFTSKGLAQSEAYVSRLVAQLLNQVIERGSFDFIEDFAVKLPMAILLNMVGVPNSDQAQINDWILRLLATDDPEYQTSDAERGEIGQRFMEYAHALAAERRQSPRDDLLSLLMAAEVDGVKLSYEEFGMFFVLLLAAGTDTPRLILGSAMLALMQQPAERARLRQAPELIPSAVEEMLRLYPPLMHFRRTAVRDVELRGRQILAGQKVVAWIVSANRDDEVFVKPHAFQLERASNPHVSFGYGPHFCIGNALARMIAKTALGECLRRMPGLEIAGPVERLRSNWFNGPKRMPVTVGQRP
jgi:cytochrome P450